MEIDTAGCRAYDRNFIVGGEHMGLGTVLILVGTILEELDELKDE